MDENEAVIVSRELKSIAKRLEAEISDIVGHKVGFSLLIYTDKYSNYISNVSREDGVRAVKTLLARWESDKPDIPEHERDRSNDC